MFDLNEFEICGHVYFHAVSVPYPLNIIADILSTINLKAKDSEQNRKLTYEKYDPLLHGKSQSKTEEILSVRIHCLYRCFITDCLHEMLFYSGLNVFPDLFSNNEGCAIHDRFIKLSNEVTDLKIEWNYLLLWKGRNLYISGNFGKQDEITELITPGGENSESILALPTKEFVAILTSDHRIWQYKLYEQIWKRIDNFICSNDEGLQEFITKIDKNSCIVALTNLGRIYNVPLLVNMPKRAKFIDIACGLDHTIMLAENGDVYSMGMGTRGQLGNGDLEDCDEATLIEALAGLKVSQIAAGGWHSAALTHDGDLYTWGWNTNGELGLANDDKVVALPGLVDFKDDDGNIVVTNIKKVQCGNVFTMCLSDDGTLWGCGSNKFGQLGQPTKNLMNTKKFIKLETNSEMENIVDIYCNEWGSCVFIK